MPHCESNCDGIEKSTHLHEHEHHNHDLGDTAHKGHEHVVHGDHFDEGWVDYLVCLFSDIEDHGSNCEVLHTVNQENVLWKNNDTKNFDNKSIAAFGIFVDYALIGQKLIVTANRVNGPPVYFERQIHLSSFSLRGPPIFSC